MSTCTTCNTAMLSERPHHPRYCGSSIAHDPHKYLDADQDCCPGWTKPHETHNQCENPNHEPFGIRCDHCTCGASWPHEDRRMTTDPLRVALDIAVRDAQDAMRRADSAAHDYRGDYSPKTHLAALAAESWVLVNTHSPEYEWPAAPDPAPLDALRKANAALRRIVALDEVTADPAANHDWQVAIRAALAAPDPAPLDVKRLARALVEVEESKLCNDCLADACDVHEESYEASIGCGDAAAIAREYAKEPQL